MPAIAERLVQQRLTLFGCIHVWRFCFAAQKKHVVGNFRQDVGGQSVNSRNDHFVIAIGCHSISAFARSIRYLQLDAIIAHRTPISNRTAAFRVRFTFGADNVSTLALNPCNVTSSHPFGDHAGSVYNQSAMKNHRTVYSTDPDPAPAPAPQPVASPGPLPTRQQNIPVIVGIERKGRGGKTVSVVTGVKSPPAGKAALLKLLKTRLGAGGALKEDVLEIQGDRRDDIVAILVELGYKAKKSGG